ncbi:hypothetical protein BABINDRAFT_7268 [Babjeviella inositovora NRRL Y-12698]|uniref:Obg family GTPase CgtA n=1 Tax=Babjeviella inositovora NRRL Y-12698 TaxID=984486 RepID=A0A1E3QS64_9ASCO|nr:uncharacterized protein BABINDRAFT_7268 [Babjeviella inositovora NRRL Y-12698]ODQ80543.1 hypothetical protein BABINDRAFT_7268 [Babjeviella inositovora NRRL Y-12698]
MLISRNAVGFYRYFSVTTLKAAIEIPQNSPSAIQNQNWLDSLGGDSKQDPLLASKASKPALTYVVKQGNDLATTAYAASVYGMEDFLFKVLSHDKEGFNDIAIPVSNYFVRSSPFSHLNNSSKPKADNAQPFADLRLVTLMTGRGGNGATSFLRSFGKAKGPPDGGDGGDGGDVYVQAVDGLHSLHKLRKAYGAEDGRQGQKDQLDGKRGDDVILTVPVGTIIKWIPDPKILRQLQRSQAQDREHGGSFINLKTIGAYPRDKTSKFIQFWRQSYLDGEGWLFKDRDAEYHENREYFNDLRRKVFEYDRTTTKEEIDEDVFPMFGLDLNQPTEKPILLMKGGRGGMGNMHFLTRDIRNPRFCKLGRASLKENFLFELKLLADIGLVGLPNAGKSTLLGAISRASPRVGHWEFTTLQPTIGTINLGIDKDSFTVADIPGIIRGANQGKGMGTDFLRHVERSGGLCFVISLGNDDPIADLETLVEEMGEKRMEGKRVLVVATKADITKTRKKYAVLQQYVEEKEWRCVPTCAMKGENIETVITMMAQLAGKLNV